MGICTLRRYKQTVFTAGRCGKDARVPALNPHHHARLNHDKTAYRLEKGSYASLRALKLTTLDN